MFELKNPRKAIPIVLIAGLLWSFGPLVVRYMNDPQLVPWQYIFGSGLPLFPVSYTNLRTPEPAPSLVRPLLFEKQSKDEKK